MLDLLRCRLLAPDTVTLQTKCGERRGLEPDKLGHFHGQDGWGVDDAGSQVRIGERGAVFILLLVSASMVLYVPPPVTELDACLDALESFIHEDSSRLPVLIKAGLLHVQFETIHPFLDGNGRIGRLLVTLYLCVNGVLRKPLLYLSLYLKTHRTDYYRLLQEVREHGNWEAWLDFFLAGVAETANQAFEAATRIVDLFKEDRERITNESDRAGSALRIHDLFQQNPFLTSNQLVQKTGLSAPTVNAALADLEKMSIVEEVTGRKRGRVFSYQRYLAILSEGTDPLPAAT